jgi:outer membrane protein assembly factor BamB
MHHNSLQKYRLMARSFSNLRVVRQMAGRFGRGAVLPGLLGLALAATVEAGPVNGWLNWRGPEQNGTSLENGLPDRVAVDGDNQLWTFDLPGQSTPVIADGKLYILGYQGDGPNLQEVIACVDAETGKPLWQHGFSDFLSDIIYHRYAMSSPAIDPDTGNVYMQGTQGIIAGFTPDGHPLWHHSMMELYGRLTFPNGRTGSPIVDADLVITRGITANWGAHGPGADRFYAFDKTSGDLVWASSPGDRPQANSFSYPVLEWWKGKRVFFAAAGDGSVVCVNARTGDPIWRVPIYKSGINSSLVVHDHNKIIAIYGTPYEPGQMMAMKIPQVEPASAAAGPVVIERSAVELWNNDLRTSTSSPILVGDRVYLTSEVGNLCAVDANTGKTFWKLKLGIEQRNAGPLYADGKLYVPILNEPGLKSETSDEETGGKGAFYIVKPNDTEGQVLCHVALDGRCLGSPTAYNGKIYVQTSKKLYCFGARGNNPGLAATASVQPPPHPGPATQLQVIPAEVLLRPGQTVSFRVRTLDANGLTVEELKDLKAVKFTHYIPPTAKVRASMKAEFVDGGQLVAATDPAPSAGAFEAQYQGLKGYFRGRVLPGLPIHQDFESMQLAETNEVDHAMFAYPPLPWIGARFKFEVRDLNGNKVLAKTIDNKFFQRATVFLGDPELNNYTVEADVMSDGNRRKMSDVGVVDQRYFVVLKGNEQKLEITSNQELFRFAAPFHWVPGAWYHLKARVDEQPDGSGIIRAKAWKKGDTEPAAWTLEVPHQHFNTHGSPGLFGFSPQEMRVYIDNISVTQNHRSGYAARHE